MHKKKNNRIVMLTPDTEMIDRRIIQEAKTLIQDGQEVILVAGNNGNLPEYELIEGIKVARPKWSQVDPRYQKYFELNNKIHLFIMGRLNELHNQLHFRINKGFSKLLKRVNKLLAFPFKTFGKISRFFHSQVTNFFVYRSQRFSQKTKLQPHDRFYEEVLVSFRPDFIHVHDLPCLPAGVGAKKRLKVPLIYDAHEFYPDDPCLEEHQKKQLKESEAHFIPEADIVFTVNDFFALEMERNYQGVSVNVLQNAVNAPSGFEPLKRYDLFREDYGIAKETPIILFQGWISPYRNLENLVRGLALCKDLNYKLVFMGYGDYLDTLKGIVSEVNLDERVLYVPPKSQEELIFYSASADIGLIPYPNDQGINSQCCSPNKLYEFIVAGTPIFSNNLPFVKTVIEENGFGYWADMQTPEAVKQAFEQFPFDQIETYRKNILKKRELFTWETESQKMLDLYETLSLQMGVTSGNN
jgi:glycosyltransferase involved in cell wall biosynthesis